jgi:hypothetical protein
MHGTLQRGAVAATNANPQSGSERKSPTQNDSDDCGWFADLARPLLGKDAGLALHYVTGFPESSCYKYASGDRKPSGYLIRALLRSEQGAAWLAALMDGSDAEWWREHQRALRIIAQIDKLDLC